MRWAGTARFPVLGEPRFSPRTHQLGCPVHIGSGGVDQILFLPAKRLVSRVTEGAEMRTGAPEMSVGSSRDVMCSCSRSVRMALGQRRVALSKSTCGQNCVLFLGQGRHLSCGVTSQHLWGSY